MNGQPLPGYYYDPEKKKYFGIQSAAASRGSHLKYSALNIRKEERIERVRQSAAIHIAKTKTQRVARRHATNLSQACAERETGSRKRSVYMQRLWPGACMSGVAVKPEFIIQTHSKSDIRLFDRDPITKTVYAVHGDNSIKQRKSHDSRNQPALDRCGRDVDGHISKQNAPMAPYSFYPWDEIGRTTSSISSLCFLPATGALATTTYGSDRSPVIQLSDPGRDGPYVSQQFTPKDCSTIRTSAACPITFEPSPSLLNSVAASHVEHLAVAADKSMLLLTCSQTGSWNANVVPSTHDSDIYALTWLSYTTIALGLRDGKILLYDTRSGGTSHVLTHPNLVSSLKRADDQTRLLCSGLNNSLCLYDIRFGRTPRPRHRPNNAYPSPSTHYNDAYFSALPSSMRNAPRASKKRKLHYSVARGWSEPIYVFPHHNVDDAELAIDVHACLGLVAAAQDGETDAAIRVSNMWTGEVLRDFRREEGGNKYAKRKATDPRSRAVEPIRSLKFVDKDTDSHYSRAGVDLWSSWKGGIASFTW